MPTTTFDYKVRDRAGNLVTGQLEGEDLALVAGRLREMGYTPIGVTPGSRLALNREIHVPGLTDRIKLKDVALVSRQMATMVASGLPVMRVLGVIAEQVDSKPLRETLVHVRSAVEQGSLLSAALAQHPKVFDHMYVSMVEAGEMSGDLDTVLHKVATSIEKRAALRAKARSVMIYPIIIVSVAILVVTAMMIFVVPTFSRLYSEFHGTLPLPTQIVIGISHVLASVWLLVIIAGLFGIGFGVHRWIATEAGRRTWDRAKLRVPIFGALAHKLALERFAGVLGSLLSAGVGIIESLELAAANVGNVIVAEAIGFSQSEIRKGRSLGTALGRSAVIPSMFTQMVQAGEASGAVGDMLERVAGFYDDEVNTTVNNLASLIEPLIIVFMAVTIGVIVVSLYLPMFKYITLVGNS